MKLDLTESVKKFIETLDETDLAKVTITSDALESDDAAISSKAFEYVKTMLAGIGKEIREYNKQLQAEHPEYFE
jgi:hypothetical protein